MISNSTEIKRIVKWAVVHHKSLSWRDEINQAGHIQVLIDWQNMPIQEKHKFLIQPILKIVQIDNNNNIKLDVSNRYIVEDESPSEIATVAITLNNICYCFRANIYSIAIVTVKSSIKLARDRA